MTGSNIFNNGTFDFTGNYTCTNNTLIISGGAVSFDSTGSIAPMVLNLSAGALSGAQNVTVGNAMSWTGGEMDGIGRTVISPNATLSINNPGVISINGRTLDNAGTILCSGSALSFNGGVITNESGALFQMQSPYSVYGGDGTRFDNAGTFSTSGSGSITFNVNGFNNYGQANIQGGMFSAAGGGNETGVMTVYVGSVLDLGSGIFTSSSNSSVTGGGVFMVSGGSDTLAGTVNVTGSNIFTSGSINFTGNYICTNKTMLISGGTVNFAGTGIVAPSLLNLSAGALSGAQNIIVGNAMNWSGGEMDGPGQTIIQNAATLTINNPNYVTLNSRMLENDGTTTWNGSGGLAMVGAVITNRPGALMNVQNAFAINNVGGVSRFDNAGTFRKTVNSGTLALNGTSFANYGTVDIQIGILAANNGYFSASNAVLNFAIGGTTPATNYGQLQVPGTVTVNGTLSVNFTNNYIPVTNDSFTVMVAGTLGGVFSGFVYPSNRVSLVVSNTPTSVVIDTTAVLGGFPAQPVLMPPQISSSNITLIWTAVSNNTYRVEFNPNLTASNWSALVGDILAVSNLASKTDTLTPSNRFYRVRVLP